MTTIINFNKKNVQDKIIKSLAIILFASLFISCFKEHLDVKSIKTKNGWGYTILQNDKILIKQTIIPVISESKSFNSEDDALKVADLVVKKLNQNISPSVTKNDLILLKIKI